MNWAGRELAELRWHWGSAYLIARPVPEVWIAQRRDDRAMLQAITPDGLHDLIRADYQQRKVPRDVAP